MIVYVIVMRRMTIQWEDRRMTNGSGKHRLGKAVPAKPAKETKKQVRPAKGKTPK
jgi:hypothetical protein